jgi:hypothetical protein
VDGEACGVGARPVGAQVCVSTHFTCFASTRVQNLTPAAARRGQRLALQCAHHSSETQARRCV